MATEVILKSMDIRGQGENERGNFTVEITAHFLLSSELGQHTVSVQASGHDLDAAALDARNRLVSWASKVARAAQQA